MQYAKLKDGASEPAINKSVSPKQLGKSREELLLATAPHSSRQAA
jgi:hypothetical protein